MTVDIDFVQLLGKPCWVWTRKKFCQSIAKKEG